MLIFIKAPTFRFQKTNPNHSHLLLGNYLWLEARMWPDYKHRQLDLEVPKSPYGTKTSSVLLNVLDARRPTHKNG